MSFFGLNAYSYGGILILVVVVFISVGFGKWKISSVTVGENPSLEISLVVSSIVIVPLTLP